MVGHWVCDDISVLLGIHPMTRLASTSQRSRPGTDFPIPDQGILISGASKLDLLPPQLTNSANKVMMRNLLTTWRKDSFSKL